MSEKNGITKEGLYNIARSRPLSRSEAVRKYNALSPKAREEVNREVNLAFYLKTGFPSDQKLDPKNPEHSKYIEEWLNQRDYVMGWSRNWEKSPGNLDTRIFRENIPATSPEVLRRKAGIFEQRLSPKEFNFHVFNKLNEAAAYDGTSTMLEGRRKIATDLAEKLFSNDTWVQNALSTKEGRNGLHSIRTWIRWEVFGGSPKGLTSKQLELVKKLDTILDPYKPAEMLESLTQQRENKNLFLQNFPILAGHIKKGLEKEGYQVEEVYYRVFTGNLIEVRAEVTKQIKVESTSYGVRGDPYVTPIITEKKNISVGGIDVRTGVYHDAAFFEKQGTVKTDWGTQLMLAEVAVLAGLGVKAIVMGARATVIGVRRAVSGTAERLVGRELRDSLDDVAGAAVRTGDTLPGVGPQRISVRIQTSDTVGSANFRTGDTLQGLGPQRTRVNVKTGDESVDAFASTQLKSRTSRHIETPEVRGQSGADMNVTKVDNVQEVLRFRNENIETLGDDVYEKASRMGMDDYRLHSYIEDIELRGVKIPQRWGSLSDVDDMIIKQINDTWSLGENNAKKLIAYGFDPGDISLHMDSLAANGIPRHQVMNSIEREIKLMDYYRNTYCEGNYNIAKNMLTDPLGAGGGVRDRIAMKIHEKLWNDWKTSDPRKWGYDYLPTNVKNDKMSELFDEAKIIAKSIENSVLGPSPAGVTTIPLIRSPEKIKITTNRDAQEKRSTGTLSEKLPKNRENRKELTKKKSQDILKQGNRDSATRNKFADLPRIRNNKKLSDKMKSKIRDKNKTR